MYFCLLFSDNKNKFHCDFRQKDFNLVRQKDFNLETSKTNISDVHNEDVLQPFCSKGCLQVENEAFLLVKLQAKRFSFSPLQFL